MTESADALDAAICVLAGADFVRGKTHFPNDFATANREGWIWFPRYPLQIISGGQTGADQGGLLGGREAGIATGGTAPQGWLTENGPLEALLRGFGLVECPQEGYPARTRANVLAADGTLLVGQYQTGGSALTDAYAREANKPVFHLDFTSGIDVRPGAERVAQFQDWLIQYRVRKLNVAGNRESHNLGIQAFTQYFLLEALK